MLKRRGFFKKAIISIVGCLWIAKSKGEVGQTVIKGGDKVTSVAQRQSKVSLRYH